MSLFSAQPAPDARQHDAGPPRFLTSGPMGNARIRESKDDPRPMVSAPVGVSERWWSIFGPNARSAARVQSAQPTLDPRVETMPPPEAAPPATPQRQRRLASGRFGAT